MFEVAVILSAISISLYLWGIVRTAIWLIPAVLFRDTFPVIAAAWMSFWLTASFFSHYSSGAYDFRKMERQKWILVFFLSGILTGTLLYPSQLAAFALGALLPLLFIKIFFLFRFPATYVLFLNKKFKFVLLFIWLACAAIRIFELRSSL